MECRRCGGIGKLTIRLSKPGQDRHAAYMGVWCVYQPQTCGVCHGTGREKVKPPPPPYRGPIEIRDPDDISRWF